MQILKLISKNYSKILLVLIFVIALTLRWWFLPKNAITFQYDQARDAFSAQQIVNGHLKIQGPSASTPGLFHGVFYYYLLAPAYFFGNGSPVAAAYWVSFLNALAVLLIFFLTRQLTKNINTSLLASFIFAISFESIQYASWLSNPTIGIWTVPLIYIGLWAWLKEKKIWGPLVTALGMGLSIQGEIFLAYHLIPVVIWLVVARKDVTKRSLIFFGITLLLTLSSMFLAIFKFGFSNAVSGAISLLSSKDAIIQTKGFGDFVLLYLNQFGKMFANSVMPFNVGYSGAFGVFGIILVFRDWLINKKEIISWQLFLLTFLFAHLSVVSLGGVSTPFLAVGLGEAAIVISSVVLIKLWGKHKLSSLIIFSVIIVSNLLSISSQNKFGQTLFAIQKDMTLKNEQEAIDYTYRQASGKPFSISTLTSPLFINTTWSYLYNWYGLKKYGYLPYWVGRDQVGQLGDNLQFASRDVNTHFFIMEPTNGIPDLWVGYAKGDQDSMSTLVDQKNFGEIVVQERVMNSVK